MNKADNARTRDVVFLGDSSQRHAREAIAHQGRTVDVEWCATDASAFKLRPAHASADTLDNEGAFEFGDCTDDDDNCSAQRSIGIDGFPLGYKSNTQSVQFIEDVKKMLSASRETITGPNEHDIEWTSMCLVQQFVESRSPRLGSTDTVIDVLADDLVAALRRKLAKFDPLGLWVLINR